MRLLPSNGRIIGGSIQLGQLDMVNASAKALRRTRGKRIAMVFQDSMTSLNPLLTIGRQITETLQVHLRLGRTDARKRAVSLLEEVGIPEPERRLRQYPASALGRPPATSRGRGRHRPESGNPDR